MNKFNLHTSINSILLLIVFVVGINDYFSKYKHDIVYIDNIQIFNGFNMTKDIKAIEDAKINKVGKELDSL